MENIDEYASTAHTLVDQVIDNAIKRLLKENLYHEPPSQTAPPPPPPPVFEDFEVQNITWLNIKEFTIEKGEEKIREFIQTWNYEDSWQYCIDYLGEDDHEFDVRHRYGVCWSIPSRRKPIPRATASIYFTFEVSKIKPETYPVEVYFVFETNRLVHRPGYSRFREKWLKDIVESKVQLMEAIEF